MRPVGTLWMPRDHCPPRGSLQHPWLAGLGPHKRAACGLGSGACTPAQPETLICSRGPGDGAGWAMASRAAWRRAREQEGLIQTRAQEWAWESGGQQAKGSAGPPARFHLQDWPRGQGLPTGPAAASLGDSLRTRLDHLNPLVVLLSGQVASPQLHVCLEP